MEVQPTESVRIARGDLPRARSLFWLVLVSGAAATACAVLKEFPWEDEFHSLLPDPLRRYIANPIYYLWLKLAQSWTDNLHALRAWSSLPWIAALPVFYGFVRRASGSKSTALYSLLFLAWNPSLIHEAANVRYYATSIFTGALVLGCGLGLERNSMRGKVWWVALPAMILHAAVVPSAGLLCLTVLIGILAIDRSTLRRVWPWMIALAALLVMMGLFFMRRFLADLWFGTTDSQSVKLPIMTGYGKAPVDLGAVAWQYEKLSGWSVWEGVLPRRLLGGFTLTLPVIAIGGILISAVSRVQKLVLILAVLTPVVVCIVGRFVINFVDTRYYLTSALPLAFGMGAIVDRLLRSRKTRRLAFAVLATAPLLLVRGAVISHHSPMTEIIRELRENKVDEVAVMPLWFTPQVAAMLKHAGLETRVVPYAPKNPPLPRWLFVKELEYVWKDDGRPPLRFIPWAKAFDLAAESRYLRKYYFHPSTCQDRLFRLRSP